MSVTMSEAFDYSMIDNILSEHGTSETAIIAILQSIQEEYHYIPKEVFPYLSKKLKVSEARIFSVVFFGAERKVYNKSLRRNGVPCKKINSDYRTAQKRIGPFRYQADN